MLQEKRVMDLQFFFIKEEETDSFRNSLENNSFKTYRGTCKFHQITCHKSIKIISSYCKNMPVYVIHAIRYPWKNVKHLRNIL